MSNDELWSKLAQLETDLHFAGTVSNRVFRTMFELFIDLQPRYTVETGSGRSTLLFSNISKNHTVFTVDAGGSLSNTVSHPLYNKSTTTIVEGPTQLTMPRANFKNNIDIAMIDGPHGFPFVSLEYYYLYPHLREGALLVLDDIHIPNIQFIYQFLKEDDMFNLVTVADNTAFFIRTSAETLDPLGDSWWLQKYNMARYAVPRRFYKRRLTMTMANRVKALLPVGLKSFLKKLVRR